MLIVCRVQYSKTGESILKALKRLKCPFPLQSHQIQGLDVANIFPVVQWLVKKVIETREEHEAAIRRLATLNYRQALATEEDTLARVEKPSSSYTLTVRTTYRPRRRFRRNVDLSAATSDELKKRVHLTLLEYRGVGGVSAGQSAKGAKGQKTSKNKSEIEERMSALNLHGPTDDDHEESKEDDDALRLMQSVDGDNQRVSSSVIGRMVEMQSDEIRNADNEYQSKVRAREEEAARLDPHAQRVSQLKKQKEAADKRLRNLEKHRAAVAAELAKVQAETGAVVGHNAKLQSDIDAMAATIQAEDASDIVKLRKIMASHEDLQKQREAFKEQCVAELKKWKQLIEQVQSEDTRLDASGFSDAQHARDAAYAQERQMAQLLAARNREIAILQRKIDMVPRQIELLQYEKRFAELYDQVAAKLDETRKYYNAYNTLEESRMYLSKELSLLDSIHSTFQNAMASKSGKEKFLDSLGGIIDGVLKNKSKVDVKLEEESGNKLRLEARFNELQEQQRQYYMAVKEFQDECRRNEELMARVESRRQH
jgi:chromosome segregation ATPase